MATFLFRLRETDPPAGTRDLTTSQVLNARMPAGICTVTATNQQLTDGKSPRDPSGFEFWVADHVIGDLDGDDFDDAAVVLGCTAGGVAWEVLVAWPAVGVPVEVDLRATSPVGESTTVELVDKVSIGGRSINVEWGGLAGFDATCCPSVAVTSEVSIASNVPSARTESVGWFTNSYAGIVQRLIDALAAGDLSTVDQLSTSRVTDNLFFMEAGPYVIVDCFNDGARFSCLVEPPGGGEPVFDLEVEGGSTPVVTDAQYAGGL